MDSQKNIEKKIQSLRQATNLEYKRPEDKTREYVLRLNKSPEALTYLVRDRKLDLKTLKHFKIGLSEKNTIAIPVYKEGKLIDYKFRTYPPAEKGFARTPNSETWIFNEQGLKVAKEKKEILITEGEIDAMTLWQAGFKNVISLVGGALGVGIWLKALDNIPKVCICLDSDEPGQKAAKNLSERIGIEKCINVKLPEKDANDFFKKYTVRDFQNVLNNSEKFPIEDVVLLKDLYNEVYKNRKGEKDFHFGYPTLDQITGGFNRLNLIVIGGEASHGKSSLLWNIALRFCQNGKKPIMLIPLEDAPRYMGRRIFNILSGSDVSRLDESQWKVLKDKVIDLPLYLYTGQEKFNLKVFREMVEKGKKLYGIEVFGIDHLHFFTKKTTDIKTEVGHIVRELISIARYYNISIFLISEIRKSTKEEGRTKMPSMSTLKDSADIYYDAHMILMVFQDVITTGDQAGKVILKLAVQKNREGRKTTSPLKFDYDLESGIISEGQNIPAGN